MASRKTKVRTRSMSLYFPFPTIFSGASFLGGGGWAKAGRRSERRENSCFAWLVISQINRLYGPRRCFGFESTAKASLSCTSVTASASEPCRALQHLVMRNRSD